MKETRLLGAVGRDRCWSTDGVQRHCVVPLKNEEVAAINNRLGAVIRPQSALIASFFVCLGIFGAMTPSQSAAEPLLVSPYRPLEIDRAFPMMEGSLQGEVGYRFAQVRWDSLLDESTFHRVPFLLRFQAVEFFEVRAGMDIFAHGAQKNGVGDLLLGTKFLFVDQTDYSPAVGLVTSVEVPVGIEPFGGDGTGISGRVLLSKTMLGSLDVDLNVGLQSKMGGSRSKPSLELPIAISGTLPVYGIVRVFAAIEALIDLKTDGNGPVVSSMVGVGIAATDSLVFDTAVEIGFTESAPRIGFALGVTWNFGSLYE